MGKYIGLRKLGNNHQESKENNREFIFIIPGVKFLLQGSSDCSYSEFGVRCFAQLMMKRAKDESIVEDNISEIIIDIFKVMCNLKLPEEVLIDLYNFSIMACFEKDDCFLVLSSGNGLIIEEDFKACINFQNIYYDKPNYIFYFLKNEEINFNYYTYKKFSFKNIGLASTGADFLKKIPDNDMTYLKELLINPKKDVAIDEIKKLITNNIDVLEDDISIVM